MLQFAKQDLICAYCPGLHCGSERGIAGHYWLGQVEIKKWPEPLMVYHPTNRIPNSCTAAASQKASHGDISGTKRGIIDPLVSKLQEKNS